MNSVASRFLASGVLVVWGVVLAYFQVSGRVASYLHPAFHPWTFASGLVLLLLGVVLIFSVPSADPEEMESTEEHPPLLRQLFGATVLVGPILFATAVSPSEFGATAVLNRGFVENVADLPAFTPPMEPPLPTLDGSVGEGTMMDPALYLGKNEKGQIRAETVDLLYAASEPTMREDFDNKEVEVIGQFLPARTGNAQGDRFHLIRMFVMCCAADARPVAVTVQAPPGTTFPEMSWIKVTGRATFPIEAGRHTAVIEADDIIEIDAPPESFIY